MPRMDAGSRDIPLALLWEQLTSLVSRRRVGTFFPVKMSILGLSGSHSGVCPTPIAARGQPWETRRQRSLTAERRVSPQDEADARCSVCLMKPLIHAFHPSISDTAKNSLN